MNYAEVPKLVCKEYKYDTYLIEFDSIHTLRNHTRMKRASETTAEASKRTKEYRIPDASYGYSNHPPAKSKPDASYWYSNYPPAKSKDKPKNLIAKRRIPD